MADLLTGIRLFLLVPVSWGLARPGVVPGSILLVLIALAIATDVLDGKVARFRGTASPRGMLFDHSADFLFVTSGLGAAAYSEQVPLWLPVLIVIAFTQYVLDSYWLFRQKQLRMSFLGRWNGILYFVPLVLLALLATKSLEALHAALGLLTQWCAYALIASTLASIVDRAVAPLRRASA